MFLRGSSVPTKSTYGSTGGRSRGVHRGAPGTAHRHARLRHAEPRLHLAGGVGRDDDDVVGLLRVSLDEAAVVAAELGLGPLGVIEEIEVVDGQNARRAPGRDERRARRVDHVPGARQHLDRRPLGAMPEAGQHPCGHARIHRRGAAAWRRSRGGPSMSWRRAPSRRGRPRPPRGPRPAGGYTLLRRTVAAGPAGSR